MKPGDKVVWNNGPFVPSHHGITLGEVYTVTDVDPFGSLKIGGTYWWNAKAWKPAKSYYVKQFIELCSK